MLITSELTLFNTELDIINAVKNMLKTDVYKLTIRSGEFTLTCRDGTWPDEEILISSIKSYDDDLEVELSDGISTNFKRITVKGFSKHT
jgi:hypothetical protein